MRVPAHLRLLRAHQWLKNGFVLAAAIFSHRLHEGPVLALSLAAFACFCLVSSGVYVLNDVLDRRSDRLHPRKRTRPVAAGEVSVGTAAAMAAALLAAGAAGSMAIGWGFSAAVAAYLALQAAYNLLLKRVVLLDVLTIALGFVVRAVAGAAAIAVTISPWLILCTLLLALFLGFSKRRHEMLSLGEEAAEHRPILREYSVPFLDQLVGIVTSATVVAYSIYTLSPEVTQRVGSRYLVLTVPFVIYGLFRYLYLVHRREKGGSPARDFFSDGPLLAAVALWGLTAIVLIYGHRV